MTVSRQNKGIIFLRSWKFMKWISAAPFLVRVGTLKSWRLHLSKGTIFAKNGVVLVQSMASFMKNRAFWFLNWPVASSRHETFILNNSIAMNWYFNVLFGSCLTSCIAWEEMILCWCMKQVSYPALNEKGGQRRWMDQFYVHIYGSELNICHSKQYL